MKYLKSGATIALVIFTVYAVGRLEAKAPEGIPLGLVAAAILWFVVLVPAYRRSRRAQ